MSDNNTKFDTFGFLDSLANYHQGNEPEVEVDVEVEPNTKPEPEPESRRILEPQDYAPREVDFEDSDVGDVDELKHSEEFRTADHACHTFAAMLAKVLERIGDDVKTYGELSEWLVQTNDNELDTLLEGLIVESRIDTVVAYTANSLCTLLVQTMIESLIQFNCVLNVKGKVTHESKLVPLDEEQINVIRSKFKTLLTIGFNCMQYADWVAQSHFGADTLNVEHCKTIVNEFESITIPFDLTSPYLGPRQIEAWKQLMMIAHIFAGKFSYVSSMALAHKNFQTIMGDSLAVIRSATINNLNNLQPTGEEDANTE